MIKKVWEATPILLLCSMIGGAIIGTLLDQDENDTTIVLAHDSLQQERVICVSRSRSINAMKAFVDNDLQSLDSLTIKNFANDSFFVTHGNGLMLLDTLDDSVLRVRTYSKLLRKYSQEAFVLRGFVRVAN